MEFDDLMKAFAAKYGVNDMEVENGAVAIDADGTRVELLDDAPARRVLVCAEIGSAPQKADPRLDAMMLQANFLLRGTDGATLCRNPETGACAIVQPLAFVEADAESLGAVVESLVTQAEHWRKVADGLGTAETERAAKETSDATHHDHLARGFLHV